MVMVGVIMSLGTLSTLQTVTCRKLAASAKIIPDWLDVLRCTDARTDPGCWSDAAAGLASLAALNATACSDLARTLKQLLLRPIPRDAAAAAAVSAKLGASLRGRAALLAEGLLPGLVGIVGNSACSLSTRAAAADAVGVIALPNEVTVGAGKFPGNAREDGFNQGKTIAKSKLMAVTSETSNGNTSQIMGGNSISTTSHGSHSGLCVLDPKVEAVRAGAVAALVGLIRGQVGQNPAAASAVKGSSKVVSSRSSSLFERSAAVREAAESLYVLMGCKTGKDAALAAGAGEVLQVRPNQK